MEIKEKKKEIKKAIADLILSIKIMKAVMEADCQEDGEMLIDVLVEELEKLHKKPEQGDTRGEGPDLCNCTDCTCDAKQEKEKTVLYFDFGSALKAVKQGKQVARKGWNGKHQYVELATCISYKCNAGEIVNCHHYNIGNAALAFVGTSGVQMGWLASQADMLAEDWYIVE